MNKYLLVKAKENLFSNSMKYLDELKWYQKPIIGFRLFLAHFGIISPFDFCNTAKTSMPDLKRFKNLLSYYFSSKQPKDFENILNILEYVAENSKLSPIVIIHEIQKLDNFKDYPERKRNIFQVDPIF